MTRKPTLAILAATAALLGGLACGAGDSISGGTGDPAATTQAAAKQPTTVKITQPITVTGDGRTARWTVKSVARDPRDTIQSAGTGRVFVSVHVDVTVTAGETFISSSDLSLITGTGEVVSQTIAIFDDRKELNAADVRAGQHVDGWVFFEAPTAQLAKAKIQLKQMSLFGDDPVGYWTL